MKIQLKQNGEYVPCEHLRIKIGDKVFKVSEAILEFDLIIEKIFTKESQASLFIQPQFHNQIRIK